MKNTKFVKFVIQGFNCITKSNLRFLLHCKLRQTGESWGGFAYHSVKLVLMASGKSYEVDSIMCFLNGTSLYALRILFCPNPDLFLTHIHISIPLF
jgi:hypothetical protein